MTIQHACHVRVGRIAFPEIGCSAGSFHIFVCLLLGTFRTEIILWYIIILLVYIFLILAFGRKKKCYLNIIICDFAKYYFIIFFVTYGNNIKLLLNISIWFKYFFLSAILIGFLYIVRGVHSQNNIIINIIT